MAGDDGRDWLAADFQKSIGFLANASLGRAGLLRRGERIPMKRILGMQADDRDRTIRRADHLALGDCRSSNRIAADGREIDILTIDSHHEATVAMVDESDEGGSVGDLRKETNRDGAAEYEC